MTEIKEGSLIYSKSTGFMLVEKFDSSGIKLRSLQGSTFSGISSLLDFQIVDTTPNMDKFSIGDMVIRVKNSAGDRDLFRPYIVESITPTNFKTVTLRDPYKKSSIIYTHDIHAYCYFNLTKWSDNLVKETYKEVFKKVLDEEFPPIAASIKEERIRQIDKWGDDHHTPEKYYTILGEEFGEIANAMLENDWENYRKELIQVAAVCVRMIQSFDKNKQK